MASYRVISADNHVFEPEDLWTSRAELKFKERVPHVERLEAGDFWFCDGRKVVGVAGGARKGVRTEEVRLGGYIPEEHIKDMDLDGVDVGIVYPTVGLLLFSGPDSELLTSICRPYNDWVGEFCSAIPKRLKAIAMLNVDDVGDGVKELERCAKMGFVGAMIAVYPLEGRAYDRPEYEPLWAAAQDLGMPLGLHDGTTRPSPGTQHEDLDTTKKLSQIVAYQGVEEMSSELRWGKQGVVEDDDNGKGCETLATIWEIPDHLGSLPVPGWPPTTDAVRAQVLNMRISVIPLSNPRTQPHGPGQGRQQAECSG